MADCERALGRPEKAIELSRTPEVADLDSAAAAELRIVVAGARADLGQVDAALVHLEPSVTAADPQLAFSTRVYYAYADLLLTAGRRQEALTWFTRAADADDDEETDAGDRIAELSADGAGIEMDTGAGDLIAELSADTAGIEVDTSKAQSSESAVGGRPGLVPREPGGTAAESTEGESAGIGWVPAATSTDGDGGDE